MRVVIYDYDDNPLTTISIGELYSNHGIALPNKGVLTVEFQPFGATIKVDCIKFGETNLPL